MTKTHVLLFLMLSLSASALALPVPDQRFEALIRETLAYPDANMRQILKENINSVARFEKVQAILEEQLDSESPQWNLAREKATFLAHSLNSQDVSTVYSQLAIANDKTYHEVISLMFAINDADRNENPKMDSKFVIGTEWNKYALSMSAEIAFTKEGSALPYTLSELLNRAGMASRAASQKNLSIDITMVTSYAVNASLSFLSQVKMDDNVTRDVTAMLMNGVITNGAPGAAFLINLLQKDPKSNSMEMASVISAWHLSSIDVRGACLVLSFANCRDTSALRTWYSQASDNLQKIGYYPLTPIDFGI
jgi:hypothetical protein